ncbi:MAG TPA: hypothetical protein IAA44_02095 [Candidatus Blautia avistercoris]|nr:hypothetical protein [Candidatus Blautia avistercoris]
MPKSNNQKLKVLYIMDALKEKGEKGEPLSMQEILKMLESHSISAERKSIYDDMEALRQYGLDIQYRRPAPSGYYLEGTLCSGKESEEGKEPETETKETGKPEEIKEDAPEDLENCKKVKILCKKDVKDKVMQYLQNPRCQEKEKRFLITGKARIDQDFYGWLTTLGNRGKLLKPGKEAMAYREYLKGIVKEYRGMGQKG